MRPSPFHKLIFWLLLGVASTFFAEVVSGSSPLVFYDDWGLVVVFPLYTLHTLVLAAMAFRNGPPRFSTLFFAGMLFGMYEAYITKVLWHPAWGPSINVLGIDLVAFWTLVPYWHPFMAFLVPLQVTEIVATRSKSVFASLPARVKVWLTTRRVLFGLAIWFGIVQTAARAPGEALVSGVINLLVVGAVFLLWRWIGRSRYELAELLPKGIGFWILAGLLGLLYLWAIPSILPERMPGLVGHISVLVLYVMIGGAFFRSRRIPNTGTTITKADPVNRRLAATLVATYLGSALIAGFLPTDIKTLAFLLNAIVGIGLGGASLIYSLRNLNSTK